jgi:NAD(P)-dependent dehydrogenase (short-subunit alcohol dehydrogenase family)
MSAVSSSDLVGRVAVVTGANTGIGKEIARGLASRGATVVLACRSLDRGGAALDEIATSTGNPNVSLMQLDQSSQASIRRFAKELASAHDRVHVLVNNAGVWLDEKKRSVDGIEMTWATNVLGYFLLTAMMRDLVLAGGKDGGARIVNVASEMARGLDLDDPEFERRPYDGVSAYSQSKQANRMWTWALARRIAGTGVTVNAMHPGWVRTELAREGWKARVTSVASKVLARSPERGARTAVWLASDPSVAGKSGGFYADERERPCRFRDEAEEARLWALCAKMAPVDCGRRLVAKAS